MRDYQRKVIEAYPSGSRDVFVSALTEAAMRDKSVDTLP